MKSTFYPFVIATTFMISSATSVGNTLFDVYDLAIKNDATLQRAIATYNVNKEKEKQAISVMFPQIKAEGFILQQDNTTTSFMPIGNNFSGTSRLSAVQRRSVSDTDIDGYSITLSQKIFDLPAWFNVKGSQVSSKQAAAQLASDQQDVIVRVTEAYFDVLRAQDNIEAYKAEERAMKRQLEMTRQRFDVGLIAITDVYEARAEYDSTVVRRLSGEGDLGVSYERLSVLTGQSHSELWLLKKSFPVINPDPMERGKWVEFSLKNNLSLKAAMHGMEAARQNAAAKKMEHIPKLTGTYEYYNESVSGTSNFAPPGGSTDRNSIGLTLSVPIFSGGGISSQRRQAHEQYNIALQTKIDTQRSVIQRTRAFHIAVMTDVQRTKARFQAFVSANSALESVQAGFDVGNRNIVDVLNAQRNLYRSIRDHANSRYDYILDMIKLKRAAGILNVQDLYDINQWLTEPGLDSESQYNEYLSR